MVLVAVGGDDGDDAGGVLAQVGEVGEHEVDPVHVGIGEHQPAVDEHDLTIGTVAGRTAAELDRHAVAADLAEPAEEDDRTASRRAGARVAARLRRDSATSSGDQAAVHVGRSRLQPVGVGPERRPAATGGLAEMTQHRLRGHRVRGFVAGLERRSSPADGR